MLLMFALLAGCEEPPPPPPIKLPDRPALDTGAAAPVAIIDDAPASGEKNRRPRLRELSLLPAAPKTATDIKLKYKALDPDGDPTDVDIEWYINGERLRGFEKRILNHEHFEKGDEVHAVVEVDDGNLKVTRETDKLTIQNTPPEIILPRGKPSKLDGFRIKATDIDDDSLTFRIEEAPPGLTIDNKGVLHFKGSMESTEGGLYPTRIIVEDGGDEYAAWEMKLTLNAAKASERKLRGAGGDAAGGEGAAAADDG